MKPPYLSGNRIHLLENGEQYFPALIAAIDSATSEVFLETYIFADDVAGHSVAAALIRAAHRNVRVHLVVDGFGSAEFPAGLGKRLHDEGVEILIFREEIARFNLRRYRLRRLHRKLACIDARLAFVGGINIIDDYDTPRHMPPRHDFAVSVEGPLLEEIHRSMQHMVLLLRWARLGRRFTLNPPLSADAKPKGSVEAAFLTRDNIFHRHDIENAYLAGIASAREDVLIVNAYFLPGRRFRLALIDAARHGIKVTVVVQGRMEYILLHYATQALYGSLLAHGIRIFEYQRSFLHAKVALIDDCWATVGSSNIDPFSLLLAREANVFVRDRAFSANLRAKLDFLIRDGAEEIPAKAWLTRSLLSRGVHWLAYALVRLLMSIAGYGHKH